MATDRTGPAGRSATSTWAPLRIGAFRGLFIAALTSNIGTWMQTVGAQWFLVEGHASPTVIALVQTASLTPTLLLALFAGALADRVDRRRLLIAVQAYGAVAAAVLAALAVTGALDAVSLLVLMFAVGCAAALTTPAWQAIQPELVPREQLRSAASLGGVAVDTARAVGPPIAGLLVATLGAAAVFAINAVSFVAVIVALLAWKPTSEPVTVHEPFGQSVLTGIRYTTQTPNMRRILVRAALFAFPASALWALLPVVASQQFHLRAIGYGAVLGTVGVGAIMGAVVMSRLGAVLSANALLALSALVAAGGLAGAAYAPLGVAVVLLLLAGVAWIATLTTLTVAAQMTLPPPLQARGLAIYLVILIGSQAFGSFVWGVVASRFGLVASLTASAVLLVVASVSVAVLPLLPETGDGQRPDS
jgi:MFS family permease